MSPRARFRLCTTAGLLHFSTLVVSLQPTALQAQQRLPVGARVRVAALPRPDWRVGTVAAADSVRLVLRAAARAKPDTIPLAGVQALEVSRGRPRLARGLLGTFSGALIGGAVGALVGQLGANGSEYDAYATAMLSFAGATGGAVIGGTVAVLTAPERWRPVPPR